jgi:nucleotide-binding universal stress UspA family protein
MKKILVPLDGSELAETAVTPALDLAARHEGTLVLASVVADLPPVPLAAGDGQLVTRWFDEEQERAEKYLSGVADRIRSTHPDTPVETSVTLGPVARSILELAANAGAEFVMMTTHGRGAWQRAWLGSVADGVLRRGTRPVILIRGEAEQGTPFASADFPTHVLVPLDGSEEAEAVLAPLTSLLPAQGGRVTLVSVLRKPFPLAVTYLPHQVEEEGLLTERKGRHEAYLSEVMKRWDPVGVQVDTEVLVAEDVARALLDFTRSRGVDLVALSTRGRGGVGRFVLGSVADKMIRGSDLPVIAVRRAGGDS